MTSDKVVITNGSLRILVTGNPPIQWVKSLKNFTHGFIFETNAIIMDMSINKAFPQ